MEVEGEEQAGAPGFEFVIDALEQRAAMASQPPGVPEVNPSRGVLTPEAAPADPPTEVAGTIFRNLMVASSKWTESWQEVARTSVPSEVGDGRNELALLCASASTEESRAFRRCRAAAMQAAVPTEILDKEIYDPLHAGVFEITGLEMGGYCGGYSRLGVRCRNKAVFLHGCTVGSCHAHREQRPYAFTVAETPPYHHGVCSSCEVPLSTKVSSEHHYVTPWSGEVLHLACFERELMELGINLATVEEAEDGEELEWYYLTQKELAVDLAPQLLLDPHLSHRVQHEAKRVRVVVLPSLLLPNPTEQGGPLRHALEFLRKYQVKYYSHITLHKVQRTPASAGSDAVRRLLMSAQAGGGAPVSAAPPTVDVHGEDREILKTPLDPNVVPAVVSPPSAPSGEPKHARRAPPVSTQRRAAEVEVERAGEDDEELMIESDGGSDGGSSDSSPPPSEKQHRGRAEKKEKKKDKRRGKKSRPRADSSEEDSDSSRDESSDSDEDSDRGKKQRKSKKKGGKRPPDSSDDDDSDSDDDDEGRRGGGGGGGSDDSEGGEDAHGRGGSRAAAGRCRGEGQLNLRERLKLLEKEASRNQRADRLRQGKLPALSSRSHVSAWDLDGSLDGLKKSDPKHLMHIEAARYENYLGTDEDKHLQRRVERIVPGLKRLDTEKDLFAGGTQSQDTYLQGDDDVKIRLKTEQRKEPRKELVLVFWRGRIAELTAVSEARQGRLRRQHRDHEYHRGKIELMVARFQYLEALVYHCLQDLDLVWGVIWPYLQLLVREYFRTFGSGAKISKLDEEIVSHLGEMGDAHMSSTSRMRDLVRSSVKQDLMTKARQHHASHQPSPAPPRPAGDKTPKRPPSGDKAPGDKKADDADAAPNPGSKYAQVAKALNVKGRPEKDEPFRVWKQRLDEAFKAKFNVAWTPGWKAGRGNPPAPRGGQAPQAPAEEG